MAKNGIKGAAETDITVDEVTLWVKAENNGIASDDKVYINGGTISVFVGNEGIKAEPENTVDETTGEVTLVDTVSEGDIILNGGNITIVASGDGVQAYQDMVVNGGSVEVTAAGDGLDSNGAINISDGRVVVFGAVAGSDNVPFDCEGQLNITGGTVFGAGSSRMAVTPASAQKYITSKTSIAQGKNIVVSDNASNELFKTEACKNVNYVIYSSAELSNEGSYTITATDATIEPTATPTARPTTRPTATPTAVPTVAPTAVPTVAPTAVPTVAPTIVPTSEPTVVKKISAKVTAKNSSSLIIKWDKAADADYYEIYRSTSKNGTYKKIKIINNVSTTSYTNSKLTCGETYYYVVKGYKKGNNENTCVAESGATSVKVIPAKTAIKTLTSKNSKVTLNWKKISGVTGYEVYRSTSKNGT